jgi:hypothetical protein
MPLTPEEKKIITFEGFEAIYHENLNQCATSQDAYEKAEARVQELIGMELFPSHEAFKKHQARMRGRKHQNQVKSERLKRYLRPKR